jgi:hypothetical protein
MGIANLVAPSGGGIKTVQRGLASGAGNVTISAVDVSKSFVTIYGTTSSGTVAVSAAVAADSGNIAASSGSNEQARFWQSNNTPNWGQQLGTGAFNNNTAAALGSYGFTDSATTFSGSSRALSGGSTNLVSAVVQGFLANSTTLTVSGACRWEVVEFA